MRDLFGWLTLLSMISVFFFFNLFYYKMVIKREMKDWPLIVSILSFGVFIVCLVKFMTLNR